MQKVTINDLEGWLAIEFADFSSNPCSEAHKLYLGDTLIEELVIPETISSIKNFVFYGCDALKSVSLASNVSSIGTKAFYGCMNLAKVYNSSNLQLTSGSTDNGYVAYYATWVYSGPENDGDFIFDTGGENGGYRLMAYKGSDLNVSLPALHNGQKYIIGPYAFYNLDIISVTIPQGVAGICEYAFANCRDLFEVRIPASVKYVEAYAFRNCTGLHTVDLSQSAFTLTKDVFRGCDAIYSVLIGSNVYANAEAFAESTLHKVVWLSNTAPKILGNVTYVSTSNSSTSETLVRLDYLSSIFEADGIRFVPLSPSDHTCMAIDATYNPAVSELTLGAQTTYRSITFDVKRIGRYLFACNSALTTVATEPEMVELPEYIFYNCTSLQGYEIQPSTTRIGANAFLGCRSMTEITIPATVSQLGNNSFTGCKALSTLTIVDASSKLKLGYASNGSTAASLFRDCPLTTVYQGRDFEYASTQNTDYMPFRAHPTVESLVVAGLASAVDEEAFRSCPALKEVRIEGDVKLVGTNAFRDCPSLEQVSVSGEVKTIEENAFRNCKALVKAQVSGEVRTISQYAFAECSSLRSADISGEVRTISQYAFAECSSLERIDLTDNVERIEPYAFHNCSAMTEVVLAGAMKSIGSYAFNDCSAMTDALLAGTLKTVGSYAFNGCSSLKSVTLGDDVETVEHHAFYNCASLDNLSVGTALTTIGSHAFSGCSALESLTLPAATTYIGDYAFYQCTEMKDMTLTDGNAAEVVVTQPTLDENASVSWSGNWIMSEMTGSFDGRKYKSNSISDNGSTVLRCTFATGGSITFVVTSSGENNYDYLTVGELDKSCTRTSFRTTLKGMNGRTVKVTYTPGDTKTHYVEFCYSKDGSITNAPDCATVYIESADPIKEIPQYVSHTIGRYAFSGCTALRDVHLGTHMQEIEDYAFSECGSLAAVVFPNSMRTIGASAFYGCTSLGNVTIGRGVTSIGNLAFAECRLLKDFVAVDGDDLLSLGASLFRNAPLERVRIGRNLNYSSSDYSRCSPFSHKSTLLSAWVTDIPTQVADYMFYGCDNLADVNVGDNIKTIGQYAFSGCSSLTSFAFGKRVTAVGVEAFSDCTALAELYAEPTVPPVCGSQALDDLNRWECTLHVPESALEDYKQAPQWKDFFLMDCNFDVTLNIDEASMTEGETITLVARGAASTVAQLNWMTTNDEVITVTDKGSVTAMGAGCASVFAISPDGTRANCQIRVVAAPVTTIELDVEELLLDIDETFTIHATVDSENTTLEWMSSDEAVATVDQEGNVTAVDCGVATITVRAPGGSVAQCVVTVFDGSITSIDAVCEEEEEVYYDLQGLRIEHPVSGNVYIVRRGESIEKRIFK